MNKDIRELATEITKAWLNAVGTIDHPAMKKEILYDLSKIDEVFSAATDTIIKNFKK